MPTYLIPENNMEQLKEKMAFVEKKCRKYNCDFTFEIGDEVFREITDETGRKRTYRFIEVKAEGRAKVNDWEFVAIIEHVKAGHNIVRSIGILNVPEKFFYAKAACEHCLIKRYRKDTYIIYNSKTGEYKQVGKSCLRDFTNGLSAEMVACLASAIEVITKATYYEISHRSPSCYDTLSVLEVITATVDKFGFCPALSQYPTKERAFKNYLALNDKEKLGSEEYEDIMIKLEEIDFQTAVNNSKDFAKKILAWGREMQADNDYTRNLQAVALSDYVQKKHFGILSALVVSYKKELDRRAREAEHIKQAEKSEYVGSIGDKVLLNYKYTTCITSWETQWGRTAIYKIIDNDDNVFTWKTSGAPGFDDGHLLKGTIKAHSEYNGEKQTELTRCRVIEGI